jgi:hypothetical protein
MLIATVCSVDATSHAAQHDLVDVMPGETLSILVTAHGFDARDALLAMVLIAKVNETDADMASTTFQKAIIRSAIGQSGVRTFSSRNHRGDFFLSTDDTIRLAGCSAYDLRVFIMHDGVVHSRTVLRGTVIRAAGVAASGVYDSGARYDSGVIYK